MAEFFSTLHLTSSDYHLGGDLPGRSQTLQRSLWIPLRALLRIKDSAGIPGSPAAIGMFYAQSWALTELLLTDSRYREHFPQLVSELNSGTGSIEALEHVYHQSPETLSRQLQQWTIRPPSARGVLLKPSAPPPPSISELSATESSELLAELARVTGHREQAQARYLELSHRDPGNSRYLASLGVLSLELGNRAEAATYWRLAVDKGTTDARLCYRFAILAKKPDWIS